MQKEEPLIDKDYVLQKFPGKGGWTYAAIPEILQNKNNPFGWVQVRGSVDEFPLKRYKLMPMGDGRLFLPVKAEIRKKIGKQAGDYVRIVLYADTSHLEIPQEVMLCFENEPREVYETFIGFTQGEQQAYLDWIYAAKTEETKVRRIVTMMDKLSKKLKLYDKENDDEHD